MSITMRTFRETDIDFALVQTAREGWDTTAETFRICLAHDPEGCFVAEVDGQRAAMITATRYARSAWVGNLIVPPEHRRQGLGQRMMEHVIQWVETGGTETLRLEADPLGVGIYRRLGFVDQFESARFRKRPPHAAGPRETTPLRAGDLDVIREFDAVRFGDDRGRLLESLMEVALAAYCVRAGGEIQGYTLVLPSAVGVRIGPCVADTPSVTGELVNSVLGDFPGKDVLVGVPVVNEPAMRLLETLRFSRTPSSLRMVRGTPIAEAAPDKLVAIANGALG